MTDRRVEVPKPQRPAAAPPPEPAPARRLDIDVSGFGDANAATDVIDPEVRAALDRAAPTAPPEEGRDQTPAPAKPKRTRSRAKPKAKPAEDETPARRKRNVLLPHRLVPGLRDRATEDAVPHGEVVVDAFVNHIEAVRSELAADRGDEERRKKLGLPARRRRQPRLGEDELERRVQVGLYMPTQAIEVIDEAAGELGISWSYLVSMLLDRELAVGRS